MKARNQRNHIIQHIQHIKLQLTLLSNFYYINNFYIVDNNTVIYIIINDYKNTIDLQEIP
ncbi:hypothetical protein VIBNISO65_810008 [Vibrio nigripulchritudo SO65]|uniref:Orphan protein n=1 Tax=Vibrio nigripulchritudo SOn1 TaxID=1238450 RepID=A0AAV2VJB8_9VIBR|nr:hypothetical protein VIBNIAM115_900002 [Vibrio nigripulchritudo AM115]CCN41414.1 hypothetical protein VIBNIFTn2_1600008 [Vibrio nigripulchritudo FTn2]CCN63090.1 hypothetical protein VIBNIPon4_110008 [Vibrio nigripulchritudo POn4]CCN79047.1 hypothetical protein VIBNISO65_810008 [Vibrio nigripulchritudo SO65]CCO44756.1 hypothetical protein VIBNISOn1_1230009 [Vibrio nigripulchritudo SOn1]